jgi:hypothetical protein
MLQNTNYVHKTINEIDIRNTLTRDIADSSVGMAKSVRNFVKINRN